MIAIFGYWCMSSVGAAFGWGLIRRRQIDPATRARMDAWDAHVEAALLAAEERDEDVVRAFRAQLDSWGADA